MSVSCAQGAVRKAVATKGEGLWEGGGVWRYFCFGRLKCQSNTIDETILSIFRFCWKHFYKLLHIIFNTNPWFKNFPFMGVVFIQFSIENISNFHIFVVVYIFSFNVTTLSSYPLQFLKTTPSFVLDWAPLTEFSLESNGHKIFSLSILHFLK